MKKLLSLLVSTLLVFSFFSCKAEFSDKISGTGFTSNNKAVTTSIVSSELFSDCNVTATDLGAWQKSVKISASQFSNFNTGDYIIITTENNGSNDERQLQVLIEKNIFSVTPIGTYGSLSDSEYLAEWKCYTLYNGNQNTKFYPAVNEINDLKKYGLLIKGKGVKVTSVKIRTVEYKEVTVETPDESESVEDLIPRISHDCKIGASDFGDAWEWSKKVEIEGSQFSDMENGDYILITTDVSKTSAADKVPQLKFGYYVNWNLYNIGGTNSLTNIEEYSSQWNTYTLKAAKQSSKFIPSVAELDLIKKNGLIIQGQAVTVTQVLICTRDYSAENPNQSGDSSIGTSSTLSDPYATNNAKHLYNYIKDNYGNKVITGQMENAWDNSFKQLDKVYADVGKYPALMGFDFMNYTMDWAIESNFNVQTERAINFWNGKDYRGKKISDSNGIVTFCWHWKDPMRETSNESYKPEEINFRIPYDLNSDSWKTSTAEYAAIMRDLDLIAAELLRLQEAGVPVIWRPLHEGAGNLGVFWGGKAWFWWGAGTSKSDATNEAKCAEAYIALWQMMYRYFTETKGIHNLIWLWNGQNTKFYPGDEYVDMIGDDIYKRWDYSSHASDFKKYQAINPNLPVALSECGTIPTLENMKKDGAMWSFFMVWNDSSNSSGGSDNFWNSENYNSMSHKLEVYNSPYAITLDDVGDLTKY